MMCSKHLSFLIVFASLIKSGLGFLLGWAVVAKGLYISLVLFFIANTQMPALCVLAQVVGILERNRWERSWIQCCMEKEFLLTGHVPVFRIGERLGLSRTCKNYELKGFWLEKKRGGEEATLSLRGGSGAKEVLKLFRFLDFCF